GDDQSVPMTRHEGGVFGQMRQVTDVAPGLPVAGRRDGVDSVGWFREVTADRDALVRRTEGEGEHARGIARRNGGVGGGPGHAEVVGAEDSRRATARPEVRRVADRNEAVTAGGEAEL